MNTMNVTIGKNQKSKIKIRILNVLISLLLMILGIVCILIRDNTIDKILGFSFLIFGYQLWINVQLTEIREKLKIE